MWTLSGFVDEISADFTEQCRVASGLGLRYVELRSAWGVNILDLDAAQLATMRNTLTTYELRVSSIGSPIGKIFIDEPFAPHLERMRHAAELARDFGAPYIRIFSFFLRPGADPAAHRDEVIERMRALARIAEDADLILLHENEKIRMYGASKECAISAACRIRSRCGAKSSSMKILPIGEPMLETARP